jgi:hypothetical protein
MVDRIPIITQDLVDYLDRLYPERSPELGEGTDTLYFRGGQRSVVRCLRRLLEEQDENITDTKVIS